jgi:uncharacterized protein (TIGR02594 family)
VSDPRAAIFAAVRAAAPKGIFRDPGNILALDNLLDAFGVGRGDISAPLPTTEPKWLTVARKLNGTREIPGPANNNLIAKGWAKLGATWFNDDATPWCGWFVAHCMNEAGLPYPGKGMFARAKSWLDWGKSCQPVLGAVVVFGRNGGGHVGFLVGQGVSEFYVLGGNQSDMVSIAPIAKSRALGYRWPVSLPVGTTPLPNMRGGVISTDER